MLGHEAGQYERIRFDLPPASGAASGKRALLAVALLLIAVAAVTGVVVALSSGQRGVAFAIGLVAVAFFSRIGC